MVPGLVSVVIPAYNHAGFVADAIRSVLSQTYREIEVLAADDGSTDATASEIERAAAEAPGHGVKIIPLLSPVRQGMSGNFNRALDRCSGEYIAFLGGDDLMLPDKLRRQVAFLRAHPDVGVCSHDMEVFDSESGRTLYRLNQRFARKDGGPEINFTTNWMFGREVKSIPSSHLFRSSIVRRHRFDERLRIMNEWLFEIDCLATSRSRWASLPEVLGRYRAHDRQTSRSAEAFERGLEETLIVLAIAGARYPELASLVRNKREFALFRHLAFDWIPHARHAAYADQFRIEAGLPKWLYMKAARYVVRRRWLVERSRPGRRLVQWFLTRASSRDSERVVDVPSPR